ncbi:MAG TPA: pitrilysin family protein [Candidatus Acidoferrum sp.]|nr:pitrilysin family protein [Candidatus Acidoferrum sp.]
MQTHVETLDNGMKVIACSVPALQTVGIALGVKYGFVDDPDNKVGISHFLEHMLFKGTKRRTWKQIEEMTKALGIDKNAFTDEESTTYIMRAYKGYFKQGMDMLSDMIRNSTLPEKEFHMEKGPIINEILMFHDNPASSDMQNGYLPKVLFKSHPAKNSSNESRAMTGSMKRSDLMRVYKSYYAPSNMVLSIYGGVSVKDSVAYAKKYLGSFRRHAKPLNRYPAREKQEKRSVVITRSGVKQTRIGIGFKSPEFRKSHMDEYLASVVVEKVLQHRLFEEVREKRGLSYEPYGRVLTYSTFGFIGAEAGVVQNKLAETKSVILKEFDKLQKGEIEKKELDVVKNELRIGYTTVRERSLDMAVLMSSAEMTEGDASLPERMPNLVMKVGLDGVRAFCSKYIDIDKYCMYVLKPK